MEHHVFIGRCCNKTECIYILEEIKKIEKSQLKVGFEDVDKGTSSIKIGGISVVVDLKTNHMFLCQTHTGLLDVEGGKPETFLNAKPFDNGFKFIIYPPLSPLNFDELISKLKM